VVSWAPSGAFFLGLDVLRLNQTKIVIDFLVRLWYHIDIKKKDTSQTERRNKMPTYKMTYHAKVERIDRIAALLTEVGYNEFVLEVRESNHLYRLTDTGIIFIFDETGTTLITGYMGQRLKVSALYKLAGYTETPQRIWKTVTRNEKQYSFLYKN
jgi:hypothetical protein